MSECEVKSCRFYDFRGSEHSCWRSEEYFRGCQKRMAYEDGILIVCDEVRL